MLSLNSKEIRETYEFVKRTYGHDVKVSANPVFQELLEEIGETADYDETEQGIVFRIDDESVVFRVLDYTGESNRLFEELNNLSDVNEKAIRIWQFEEAPEYLKVLSGNGGDEDWLALIPSHLKCRWIHWLEANAFGTFVEVLLLPGNWQVKISSHS